jgi:hypothetical protein
MHHFFCTKLLLIIASLASLCSSYNSMYFPWFLICSYVPNPVLVIIDVQPKELGIPTKAYYAVEEVKEVSVVSWVIYASMFIISIYIVVLRRMLPRKVKKCLSMFLRKLLLMKLRKSVWLNSSKISLEHDYMAFYKSEITFQFCHHVRSSDKINNFEMLIMGLERKPSICNSMIY